MLRLQEAYPEKLDPFLKGKPTERPKQAVPKKSGTDILIAITNSIQAPPVEGENKAGKAGTAEGTEGIQRWDGSPGLEEQARATG